MTGKRVLIHFNRLPAARNNGDVPDSQSHGYLDFYEAVVNSLVSLEVKYPVGYKHLRATTRQWVRDAR